MIAVHRLPTAAGRTLVLCAALALAGCGRSNGPVGPPEFDPAMTAAIEAPIMVDPDLSLMNARFAALSPGGPADGSLPTLDVSDSERLHSRAEALALAGGELLTLPAAQGDAGRVSAISVEIMLSARATRITGRADCTSGAGQAMIWGARLPASLPAYPRAHLLVALGGDAKDCDLRAASFVAVATADDALGFYATLASRAGFTLVLSRDNSNALLEGETKGGRARFGVLVRPGPRETVLIDVVTLNA
ncbi:MAG: hypothetical protein KGL48_14550 [Sphingomonadales bacterium]|nr:hypothetical protein [Sphingomonadales bacterium]MDE2568529.1 hypothetical protein [Sphingomonadales bacterium]